MGADEESDWTVAFVNIWMEMFRNQALVSTIDSSAERKNVYRDFFLYTFPPIRLDKMPRRVEALKRKAFAFSTFDTSHQESFLVVAERESIW